MQIKITDIEAEYQSSNCNIYMPPYTKTINVVYTFQIPHSNEKKNKLTFVVRIMDNENIITHDSRVTRNLYGLTLGISSSIEDIIASICTN